MKPSLRLLEGMPYTPAAETTVDYLRAKFRKIQREIEAQKGKKAPVTKLPERRKA